MYYERAPYRQEWMLWVLENSILCECVSHFILKQAKENMSVYNN